MLGKVKFGGRRIPENGPCSCDCHDSLPGVEVAHCVPCCTYSGTPRAEAEADAMRARFPKTTEKKEKSS